MKQIIRFIVCLSLIVGWGAPLYAVTVYLKDGTRLEVEKAIRRGNLVYLFLDISQIDTTRTQLDDMSDSVKTVTEGLAIVNIKVHPSEDDIDLIGTGDVINHFQHTVHNVRVTAILMDKNDTVLLRVQGYVRPAVLEPGQTGTYRFQVPRPQGFWKAQFEVQGEAFPAE